MGSPAIRFDSYKNLVSSEWKRQDLGLAKTDHNVVEAQTFIYNALKAFEDAYNNWEGWKCLGRETLANTLTECQKLPWDPKLPAVQKLEQAKQWIDKRKEIVDKVKAKLMVVKDGATLNSAKFQDHALVPHATREFLQEMAKDCDRFFYALQQDLNDRCQRITKLRDAKRVKPKVPTARPGAHAVTK